MSSSAVATSPLEPVSPNCLGFCQRCGDPISGRIRCSRCGGSSKEPRVRSNQVLPAAKKPDPWAHRYVSAHSASQDEPTQEYLHNQPPPLSPDRASYDAALGFGMPSRISSDLRSCTALGNQQLHPSRLRPDTVHPDPRRASQDYTAPLVKGSDGVLSKVCGSLVEPSSSRNRWSCSDCSSIFARDSTLYAPPTSSSATTQHDTFYCRDCYAKRYSLGDCKACGRNVLGSTKEDGKYVKASTGIWHGRCWKCSICDKLGGKNGLEVMIGMDGNPTCEICFDRPNLSSAQQDLARKVAAVDVPDVRRLTRVAASRNGAMGATIAELTKKLGQQSISSPRPFSSRSSSNTSLTKLSSSHDSLNALSQSPSKAQYAFPNHIPSSLGKTGITQSASLAASPPKPRPLTAQFRDGLNLAAFKPSLAGNEAENKQVQTSDSRSRSASPVKRPEWKRDVSPMKRSKLQDQAASATNRLADQKSDHANKALTTQGASKDPGNSSSVASLEAAKDLDRDRTTNGFPRPLNSSSKRPEQNNQPLREENAPSGTGKVAFEPSQASQLEPAEGTTRCAACGLLPFEPLNCSQTQEVVMVTLSDNIHLHADCFRCSICHEAIDGRKSFIRVQDQATTAAAALVEGLPAYAHPQCAPTVQLHFVQVQEDKHGEAQRSFKTALAPTSGTSHATHQRELKPSPVPSPSATVREKELGGRAHILPDDSAFQSGATTTTIGAVRRFQSTAGAAPPTRSTILAHRTPTTSSAPPKLANPAAGIFSRLSALSTASGNPSLLSSSTLTTSRRYGGMQTCAFCGCKLSSLESVLGPRGTAWHKTCLICRAPRAPPRDKIGSTTKPLAPICAKQLDSGAKVNKDGEVRCRDCYDRESSSFSIKT